MGPADPFVAERLEVLERLIAEHPNTPEVRTARRLAARCRFHLRRGLRPLTRRHLLFAVRAAARSLESLPRSRGPP